MHVVARARCPAPHWRPRPDLDPPRNTTSPPASSASAP